MMNPARGYELRQMATKVKTKRKLTYLQERFCSEYVIDLNGTKAILRAGSKSKYPEASARQMLRKYTVQKRIGELMQAAAGRNMIEQDHVIGAFAEIGFLDPAEMFDEKDQLLSIRRMPRRIRRAISSLEIEENIVNGKTVRRVKKIRLCNKNDALEKLAKHLGLFERDNEQRRQLTIVDIMAIVGVKNGNSDSGTQSGSE
jgi:phage terminase small subunit